MENCDMCGVCCKWVIIENVRFAPELIGYYAARGWTYNRKTKMLWIPDTCLYLTDDNKCRIYENRPLFCRNWKKWKHLQPGITDGCGCMKG
jgi:Fe-S-cluster containining protein